MTTLFSKPQVKVAAATPALPPPPPPAPTIDTAAQTEDLSRKFLRRKGRMATYVSGASATAPAVATKQLLG